ncbi:hypothetical protein GQ602_006378 [Ophiocordyceps camponoti-floridani]|uniref:Uncharacterized protein n=1 Tax=Ophiocordyceps camponoti-floridani TaxID=2030778 RepID=A0A8H4Q3H1_9HYPO|nr:hypothetical protein GQ602_006378 [Ophiocordyceps camponoti-floridani]
MGSASATISGSVTAHVELDMWHKMWHNMEASCAKVFKSSGSHDDQRLAAVKAVKMRVAETSRKGKRSIKRLTRCVHGRATT